MSTDKSTAPMFERRQYEAVAQVLAELRDRFDNGGACQFGVECAADDLAVMFSADNPRFDNERFREACGVVGEVPTCAERDRLAFQFAASKIDPETTSADLEGPGKYDGASDRVLAWSLETLLGAGAADDVAGDVESGRHLARFGRYVLETDSQGFVDVFIAFCDADAQAALDREAQR